MIDISQWTYMCEKYCASNRQAFNTATKTVAFRVDPFLVKVSGVRVSLARNIFSTDSRFHDIPEIKVALTSYYVHITKTKIVRLFDIEWT